MEIEKSVISLQALKQDGELGALGIIERVFC
jgi:hypothetical protein